MTNKKIISCFVVGIIIIILLTSIVNGNNSNEPDENQIKLEYYHYEEYFTLNCIEYTEGINKNIDNPVGSNSSNDFLENIVDGPMDSAWSMQSHDTHHTGRSPYSTENNPGIEKWRFLEDHWIDVGPVIDNDGIIYIADSWGDVSAICPNGTLKWKFTTEGQIMGSTPAIAEDGTLYIGTWYDFLYAINSNGTEKWRFNAGDVIASSPAIAEDGTIYFGIMGPGTDKGRIYAVNPNGTEKWHYDVDYYVTSDPAIGDDGTIYIGSMDNYFYALYPNGTLRWRFETENYIKGPASIAEDGTLYVGSWDDYLYAIYPNGTRRWQYAVAYGTETNPSIASDGTVYVGGWERLWAIYPNGTLRWEFDLGSDRHIHKSSPAICADGTIYVGTNIGETSGGEIIAVNSDGSEKWRKMIANEWVDSSPAIGEDGTVYIGSAYDMGEGYLYAFGDTELEADAHGPYVGIINEPVQFRGTASGGYSPYAYHWDFGDEETSDEQNPTHEYDTAGNYTVTLTVTDDHDNTSDDTTWANIKEFNDPPDTPERPEGNIYGKINTEYTYSSSTVDSDPEDLIYYMWDWGDSDISDWTEPYHSGETCALSHMWIDKGSYEIRVKAKDNYDNESNWSVPLEIYRTELTLNIKNNFLSITAEIENTGEFQLDDVDWSFSVTGGILNRINKQQSDTIPVLLAGGKESVSSGMIFGLGRITVTVTAVDESKTANGLVIGPFIFIK